MQLYHRIIGKLSEPRAQILLPAVLLAPIFILVVYLLFETAKVSMTKVRQQFALDNAAYTQVSSTSTYLNVVGQIQALGYRNFQQELENVKLESKKGDAPITAFDIFYKGGGFPAIGPEYGKGYNPPPPAESMDWGFKYYEGDTVDSNFPRSEWEKENPSAVPDDKPVPIMSKSLAENYFVTSEFANTGLLPYLLVYATLGSIYEAQDYIYKAVSKNAAMFRETYYLNVNDCKPSECARQSAAKLRPFLDIRTKPFEIAQIEFYFSEGARGYGLAGAYARQLNIKEDISEISASGRLFQFAYLDPSSRGKLKSFARGIQLKQPFKLPRNYFNINLEQKYKPYVRNRVVLSCPRNSNNCVWPNPLPKYTVTLEP